MPPQDFSVALFGDCQGADNPLTSLRPTYLVFNNIIEQVNKTRPYFTAVLGDMVSSGRAYHYYRFRRQLSRLHSPGYVVLGNHDAKYNGRQIFKFIFGPAYYSLIIGANAFIFLDNAEGSLDAAQLTWLESQLRESSSCHIYVFMHQPVFDPRPGGNYAMNDREQAARLQELFRAAKVKAVFASHLHGFYQAEDAGVKYYITGGAGSTLTSPQDYYHYLRLDISGPIFKVSAVKIQPHLSPAVIARWSAAALALLALAILTFFAVR